MPVVVQDAGHRVRTLPGQVDAGRLTDRLEIPIEAQHLTITRTAKQHDEVTHPRHRTWNWTTGDPFLRGTGPRVQSVG